VVADSSMGVVLGHLRCEETSDSLQQEQLNRGERGHKAGSCPAVSPYSGAAHVLQNLMFRGHILTCTTSYNSCYKCQKAADTSALCTTCSCFATRLLCSCLMLVQYSICVT
jgi:hypothetical protein